MRNVGIYGLVLAFPVLVLAHGCGSADSTKTRPSRAEAGGAPGEAGAPGNDEGGAPAGEAGASSSSGGSAGEPSSGGSTGEPSPGGAPNEGGAGPSGGSGGTNGGGFRVGCEHPFGTYCTEFSGVEEEVLAYAQRCSNLEMSPVESCSKQDVSGVCIWTDFDGSYEQFYYFLDEEELETAQEDCYDLGGTWAIP